MWCDHSCFSDCLSYIGWDLLWSTVTPNLNSLCSPTTKIGKAIKNVKMGWFGSYGSPKVTGNVTIRWIVYDFLLDFNRNYASVLYCFCVTASYLSTVAYLNLPHLHLAPSLGWSHSNFAQICGVRVPGLSCGIVYVILCLAVLIQYRHLMDRRSNNVSK